MNIFRAIRGENFRGKRALGASGVIVPKRALALSLGSAGIATTVGATAGTIGGRAKSTTAGNGV